MTTGKISVANCDVSTIFEWKIPTVLSLLPNQESKCQPIHSPCFAFSDSSWFLKMCWSADGKWTELYLHLKSASGVSENVHFKMEVMTSKGVMFTGCSSNRVFKEGSSWGFPHLVTVSELKHRKNNLISSGALIVICHIRSSTSHPRKTTSSSDELIKLDTLSSNLRDLFDNKETCDAVLRVKDKEFQAHRFILMARSSVFADIFSHDSSEKQSGIVKVPDCDADSFDGFLEFLYTGKLEKISVQKARDLYVTASKYDVQELKEFCVTSMTRDLAVDNVCDIIILADLYKDEELLSFSQIFFNENFGKIFSSTEWLNLKQTHTHLANKMLEMMASTIKSKEDHCVATKQV